MRQKDDSTKQEESQLVCPIRSVGQYIHCVTIRCALWDKLYRECGILSISDELGKIVDVLIDRRK